MTAKEVSALLKVSTWTVYELVKTNKIPHFKCGRAVRFRFDDLENWMKQQG